MDTHSHVQVFEIAGFLPALQLPFGIVLPVYFLITSLAFIVCLFWLVRRSEAHGLSRNTGLDISLVLMVTGFVGARLFHILIEEPSYYFESPMRAFEVWRGGFVWYGGALVGAGCSLVFMRVKSIPLPTWLDVFAPIAALGYALGRVACLFTGCCYGSVVTLASGFQFRHPSQVYAIVWELLVLALLLRIEQRQTNLPATATEKAADSPGDLFLIWMALHATGRLVMEYFRADPRGYSPLGLSPANWISAALLLAAVVLWRLRSSARNSFRAELNKPS